MKNNWKIRINNFFTIAIVFLFYLFAFGLFISRKLVYNCTNFICLFGLIQLTFQLIVMRENPLKKFKDNPLNLPILLFAFALIISFIIHPYNKEFSNNVRILQHLLILLFFYIVVSNLRNLNQVKRLITVASVSMGIVAIFGCYQYLILKINRAEGFFNPLSLGGFLAIFITFLITYGLWSKTSVTYRIAICSGIIFLGVTLLFTKARGAWLALLGGIFTLGWLKDKKMLAALLIICFLLLLFLPQVYIDRFKSSFDISTNESNLTRITLWKSALLMYRDHPITGVGLNRFEEEYIKNYRQPEPVGTTRHPHNIILKFMAETGTIGLIAFLWMMITIIVLLYKYSRQITNPQWRLFPLASLCGIIIFNIQGLTNVNYGGNVNGDEMSLFWFLIILNIVIANACKEDSRQHKEIASD